MSQQQPPLCDAGVVLASAIFCATKRSLAVYDTWHGAFRLEVYADGSVWSSDNATQQAQMPPSFAVPDDDDSEAWDATEDSVQRLPRFWTHTTPLKIDVTLMHMEDSPVLSIQRVGLAPMLRGRGLFSSMLDALEQQLRCLPACAGMHVMAVRNMRLVALLERRGGWQRDRADMVHLFGKLLGCS